MNSLKQLYVKELLGSPLTKKNILDKEGNNVFHLLMKRFYRNVEDAHKILILIINHSSEEELKLLNSRNYLSFTPMFYAFKSKSKEAVDSLFKLNRGMLKARNFKLLCEEFSDEKVPVVFNLMIYFDYEFAE